MPTGLGDEQLWISATNDNTGTSTAFSDLSGEGNDGTANGGMLVVADTSEGGTYAFDFDGSNGHIEVLGGVGSGTTDAFCIAFWWNWAGTATQYVWDMDYTENNGLSVVTKTASPRLQAIARPDSDGSGNTYMGVITNTWEHIVYQRVAGSNQIKSWRDGVENAVVRTASDPVTLGNDLTIGAANGGILSLDGMLDDIRWFNKSLTQAEITHLATSRGIEGPAELSTRYYDFGPDAAPVKAGYQKVTEAAYDADLFGWGGNETTGQAINSAERATPADDMEKDFCWYTGAAIFRDPTVVTGTYELKAYAGDSAGVRDCFIDVWDGSAWVATSIQMGSIPAGTISTATATVEVGSNGVNGLYIRVNKSTQSLFALCGIDLTPAGGPPPTTGFYNPFINKIFFNDYTRRIR